MRPCLLRMKAYSPLMLALSHVQFPIAQYFIIFCANRDIKEHSSANGSPASQFKQSNKKHNFQLTMGLGTLKIVRAGVQLAALTVFGYQILVAFGKYNDVSSAVTVSTKELFQYISIKTGDTIVLILDGNSLHDGK